MSTLAISASRILLIIGGGVAAYKSLELIRRLRERGAEVRVVMTAAAKQFVSPLSAASLSGAAVRDDLFSLDDEAEMGHIELSRAADLIVVAPATADLWREWRKASPTTSPRPLCWPPTNACSPRRR